MFPFFCGNDQGSLQGDMGKVLTAFHQMRWRTAELGTEADCYTVHEKENISILCLRRAQNNE